VGEEIASSYNKRLDKVLKKLKYKISNFVLVDEGPAFDLRTLLVIKNNRFLGYKVVDKNKLEITHFTDLEGLTKVRYHPAIDQQIKKYILKNKDLQIIEFEVE